MRCFQTCDLKHGFFMYMPRIETGFAIQTGTKEHQWVNSESARWICDIIRRAQPQRIGMQQHHRMASVSTS